MQIVIKKNKKKGRKKEMTKSKNTKKALLTSIISMVLCVTMLLGSTLAWFTDEVKSEKNKIVAGNLDVELEWSYDGTTWEEVTTDTDMFENTLWEPGYTAVRYLRVKNVGDMALKGQLGINVVDKIIGTSVEGNEIDLSNILKYSVVTASDVEKMNINTADVMDPDDKLAYDQWGISYPEKISASLPFEGTEINVWGQTFDLVTARALAQYSISKTERLVSESYPTTKIDAGTGAGWDNPASHNQANKEQAYITVLPGEDNTSEIFALVVYMPSTTGNEANYVTGTTQPSVTLGITFTATQKDYEEDSFDEYYDWDWEDVYVDVPEPGSGDVNIEIGM